MAGLNVFYQDLDKILGLELALYENLLLVAGRKQKTLVANDLESFQECVYEEQDLLQDIADTASKRDMISAELAKLLGIRDKRITLSKIIDRSAPDFAASLSDVSAQLKDFIHKIQALNRENERLLQFAIYSIHELVGTIFGFQPEPSQVYTLRGRMDNPRSESGIFNLRI